MARPVSGTISMNGLEEKVTIRALRPEEYPLLADLLYEAIFVPERAEVPPRAVVHDPALSGYWAAFGSRPGDRALCAVAPEGVVGAVWARRMRGYGFVADDVPELAMALWPAWRGRGLGTRLLQALLRQLRGEGGGRCLFPSSGPIGRPGGCMNGTVSASCGRSRASVYWSAISTAAWK